MQKERLLCMFAGDQLTYKKAVAGVVSEYSGHLHTTRIRSSQLD